MPVPVFPFLGFFTDPLLLDPVTVFTPLTVSLGVFSLLCGLGIGALLDRMYAARTARASLSPTIPETFPKAA
jgi:hypothetical protein